MSLELTNDTPLSLDGKKKHCVKLKFRIAISDLSVSANEMMSYLCLFAAQNKSVLSFSISDTYLQDS